MYLIGSQGVCLVVESSLADSVVSPSGDSIEASLNSILLQALAMRNHD